MGDNKLLDWIERVENELIGPEKKFSNIADFIRAIGVSSSTYYYQKSKGKKTRLIRKMIVRLELENSEFSEILNLSAPPPSSGIVSDANDITYGSPTVAAHISIYHLPDHLMDARLDRLRRPDFLSRLYQWQIDGLPPDSYFSFTLRESSQAPYINAMSKLVVARHHGRYAPQQYYVVVPESGRWQLLQFDTQEPDGTLRFTCHNEDYPTQYLQPDTIIGAFRIAAIVQFPPF